MRAVWHEPDLDIPGLDDDPFDPPSVARPVEEVGTPIDLDGDTAKLSKRLTELAEREMRLAGVGIECSIKDRDDTSCSACPVHGREETAPLCEVGVEQERVCTRLAVLRCSK